MLYETIETTAPPAIQKEVVGSNSSAAYFSFFLRYRQDEHNSLASTIPNTISEMRSEKLQESLSTNIEHRLEFVAKTGGVTFINDSKATTIHATWYALETMTTTVILIMGGVGRNNDYAELLPLIQKKVAAIVCLGKDTKAIQDAYTDHVDKIVCVESMRDAVYMSYRLAPKDATVLLSPACSSFDLFKNYEDRGNQFKKEVEEL